MEISYQGGRVSVTQLIDGYDDIVYDTQGFLYRKSWNRKKKAKEKTPHRRKQIRYTTDDIEYIKYDNLGDLQRGLVQAVLGGSSQIIYWQELSDRVRVAKAKIHTLDEYSEAEREGIRQELKELLAHLKRRKAPELKEAQRQVAICIPLRDKRGQFNIGVIQMKLLAVQDRFDERLGNITGWHPKMALQLTLVSDALLRAYADVENIEKSMLRHTRHPILKNGKFTNSQVKNFCTNIELDIDRLRRWSGIRPFTTWARYSITDLVSLQVSLQAHDLKSVRVLVDRLHASAQYKQLQLELFTVLEKISLNEYLKKKDRVNAERFRKRLQTIAHALNAIDDNSWREQVVSDTIRLIGDASMLLSDNQKQRGKEHLKEALSLF